MSITPDQHLENIKWAEHGDFHPTRHVAGEEARKETRELLQAAGLDIDRFYRFYQAQQGQGQVDSSSSDSLAYTLDDSEHDLMAYA